MFVTLFICLLNVETGKMVYTNAGHNPPYLVRNSDQRTDSLPPTGIPIGLDRDTVWQTATINIEPGDALLLYTDGIPDSINGDGDFFDDKKFLAVAQKNLSSSAYGLQASIIDDLHAFTEGAAQVDDITLMVLKHYRTE